LRFVSFVADVDEGGVNRAEVDAVVAAVRDLAERKTTGIGVITPYRDQTDAIEPALPAAFPVEDIERLRLCTGAVHAFQGSEADTVAAHLERQRALLRTGWALSDTFASRWSHDPVCAALELAVELR
jgi:hypothetical protein